MHADIVAHPTDSRKDGSPAAFVLRWRRAIAGPNGPRAATTRHVLLTLSIWMDDDGGSCFPSTQTIAAACALSERTVCTHLELADAAGWIRRQLRGAGGQGWRSMEYFAALPSALNDVQHDGANVLKEIQHDTPQRTERDSAPSAQRTEPNAERTEPNDRNVLKEVQSNSPENSPENSPNIDMANRLWAIWIDELGGEPPHPKLTEARRRLLRTLHAEQLTDRPDPEATFRAICRAVKASTHHMATRAYQMPESLFRNTERRERWTLEATAPKTATPTDRRPDKQWLRPDPPAVDFSRYSREYEGMEEEVA